MIIKTLKINLKIYKMNVTYGKKTMKKLNKNLIKIKKIL